MCLLRVKTGRGKGQVVDVSLYESVFGLMESLVPEYSHAGFVRERAGGRLPGISPSNTYRTADDVWIVIAGNSDAIYRRLMTAIGRRDLAEDPALQTNDGRVAAEEMIDRAIGEWTAARPAGAVLETMREAGVPCDRIYSVADMTADAQFRARETILDTVLPDGTPIAVPGILPKLSATPGRQRWLGGEVGQHTAEVLSELGFSLAELEALKQRGVIA